MEENGPVWLVRFFWIFFKFFFFENVFSFSILSHCSIRQLNNFARGHPRGRSPAQGERKEEEEKEAAGRKAAEEGEKGVRG